MDTYTHSWALITIFSIFIYYAIQGYCRSRYNQR